VADSVYEAVTERVADCVYVAVAEWVNELVAEMVLTGAIGPWGYRLMRTLSCPLSHVGTVVVYVFVLTSPEASSVSFVSRYSPRTSSQAHVSNTIWKDVVVVSSVRLFHEMLKGDPATRLVPSAGEVSTYSGVSVFKKVCVVFVFSLKRKG